MSASDPQSIEKQGKHFNSISGGMVNSNHHHFTHTHTHAHTHIHTHRHTHTHIMTHTHTHTHIHTISVCEEKPEIQHGDNEPCFKLQQTEHF